MPRIALLLIGLVMTTAAYGQVDRRIMFPDVGPYLTLVCDLHMHTVFSDGSVWPDIRVQEAHRDDLDAIAVTDHLEYLPHIHDIPLPDRNRSYEVAKQVNNDHPLIVINGSEITREMPPGHANAIFIQDSNRLVAPYGEVALDVMEVFREAKRQGAYVFWNHPMWVAQRSDGVATLTDLHHTLLDEGLMQGIEVVNEHTYSDEALQIALDHDLAILATSDIHGFIDWEFSVPEGGHRPVTLVFADERSEAGIQAALEARRTVAWHRNTLIGREDALLPLIEESIQVASASLLPNSSILSVQVHNRSDARFVLRNVSGYTLHLDADLIELAPQDTTEFQVKTLGAEGEISMQFEVFNAIIAPRTHASFTLTIALP